MLDIGQQLHKGADAGFRPSAQVEKVKHVVTRGNVPVILSHLLLVVLVVTVLMFGFRPGGERNVSNGEFSVVGEQERVPTVDEVASAEVAASAARTADYLVSNNVAERADTVLVKTALAQSADGDYLSKPQFVDQGSRKGVTKYQVKSGDTVPRVADEFNLHPDSIKFSNNLRSDALTPGQELLIPKTDGIVYTVKAGDTPDSLAGKYKTGKEAIILANDAELGGLVPGQLIVIPGAVVPTNERPGATFTTSTAGSSSAAGFAFGTGPVFGGNGYAYGYCTWHAANRRAAVGRQIPTNWGNATTWDEGARAMGLRVDRVPEVGAIMQTDGGWGGFGHVAFVEQVNSDGSWVISEMNYAGWGRVSSRSFSAADAAGYDFIH